MSTLTVIGIVLVILLIIGVGVIAGRKVSNATDFLTGGGSAGPWLVCGAIMGSLVSSQATIGTAQLAFNYGLSAWWFTLGSGIGCLILAVVYAKPLRNSGCLTETQIISKEYGKSVGSLGSILCSVGIFISVLAQVVSCTGLISVLFPDISISLAALLSVAVMIVYVIFGGAWGAGMGGVLKLVLLYVASVIGLVLTLNLGGGLQGMSDALDNLMLNMGIGKIQSDIGLTGIFDHTDVAGRYFNLTARGTAKDLGSGISLLLGVLATQTYAQAIWSASSDKRAKLGGLLSAFLIPPIGIAGICIGIFMRNNFLIQAEVDALIQAGQTIPDLPVMESSIQVFPTFIITYLPPIVAGIILGTLLITVVGGGAGLSLGMATILVNDIYKRISKKSVEPKKELTVTRGTIAVILLIAMTISILMPGKMINDLGFLSMGLRATVVFMPLTMALWAKGKVQKKMVMASMILAPLTVIIWKLASLPGDSLFPGMAVSILCCLLGYRKQRASRIDTN